MKLSFRSFLHERIECGDLLMISFCTGGFRYRQHIYYQHANNPASYVGSLILWLKKLNWICSGNLCSHLWMALIMMLKLFMKLLQHQKFRTVQYKEVECFSRLPPFLIDKYCCRWLTFRITSWRNFTAILDKLFTQTETLPQDFFPVAIQITTKKYYCEPFFLEQGAWIQQVMSEFCYRQHDSLMGP